MNGEDRIQPEIAWRLARSDGRRDGLRPRGNFRVGHEAAVVELIDRIVGKLPGVEEGAHC